MMCNALSQSARSVMAALPPARTLPADRHASAPLQPQTRRGSARGAPARVTPAHHAAGSGSDLTCSTSAATSSGSVSGSTPWPRLKMKGPRAEACDDALGLAQQPRARRPAAPSDRGCPAGRSPAARAATRPTGTVVSRLRPSSGDGLDKAPIVQPGAAREGDHRHLRDARP